MADDRHKAAEDSVLRQSALDNIPRRGYQANRKLRFIVAKTLFAFKLRYHVVSPLKPAFSFQLPRPNIRIIHV